MPCKVFTFWELLLATWSQVVLEYLDFLNRPTQLNTPFTAG